jgi:aspartokinase-like uncharacterized kinase
MKLRGYVEYGVDYVVKFGGSLLNDIESCRMMIQTLAGLARDPGTRFLVIPGGGPTDKAIEKLDKLAHFHSNTHHRACARAQDQTGLMICDPFFCRDLVACETLEEVRFALDTKSVPVLLPSRTIFDLDPFERIWEISSDGMAAWYSWLVHCRELIVLTDVDGVFERGETAVPDRLIPEITASDLAALGHNAVDECTAPFLAARGINAWVLNGRCADRLALVVQGRSTRGTRILGR